MVLTLDIPIVRPLFRTEVVDYATWGTLIHAVRTEVFVYEQQIPPDLEVDSLDWRSQHVLARHDGKPIGTGRLTPDGRIGRVAVAKLWRRQGVGFCVMQVLLDLARQNAHPQVVLSAQCHAVRFYERLGFQPEGDIFIDVGIPHITMRKQL